MTETLEKIVKDFEAELLASIARTADEAPLHSAEKRATDRLLAIKESFRQDGRLEEFFSACIEINAKLNMALKAVRS
ncbi:hypothetical protein RAD16_27635 [Bradyrhizobium sp. 18BD]